MEFSKTIKLFNLSSLEARLFAYLYITTKPKTLDEMSEALDKSKTSMSTSARNLYDRNLISLVWQKGVRKDLYEANKDLFKVFMESHLKKWGSSIQNQKESIEEIKYKLNDAEELDINHELNDRIEEIINFHQQINNFLNEKKTKL